MDKLLVKAAPVKAGAPVLGEDEHFEQPFDVLVCGVRLGGKALGSTLAGGYPGCVWSQRPTS